MTPVRVLVVEDSITVRERLVEVLSADPEIAVVGEAADGRRAIELCQALRPDVVTLDMMLPVMSGLAATEYIMAYCPTPIVIVSASINRGELFRTYDALSAGALDVMDKPRADEDDGSWGERFRATVKLVSRIKVITHPRMRLGVLGVPTGSSPPPPPSTRAPQGASRQLQIVGIGASTGGPAALVHILKQLPPVLAVPLVVVLHIDETFGSAFAEWLDAQSPHRVAYAKDREHVASFAGRVAMAPPGRHLVVRERRFWLVDEAPRHSCRPSIDALFETVAHEYGAAAAGCLLTGMGRDGAVGLLEMRKRGALTIAQDEATSVVYGMPREAALLGAVELVLPLEAVGATVAALVGAAKRPP